MLTANLPQIEQIITEHGNVLFSLSPATPIRAELLPLGPSPEPSELPAQQAPRAARGRPGGCLADSRSSRLTTQRGQRQPNDEEPFFDEMRTLVQESDQVRPNG